MAIIRSKRDTNYTIISNLGLKDEELSWKAKGLLAYMLSLPDDWIFYQSELEKRSTDKEASVRSALKELEERGYLVKNRARNDKGQFESNDWIIYDEPRLENPVLDNPVVENPALGNQALLNTNNTKDLKELSTNDKDIVEQSSTTYPFSEIVDYLNEKAETKYRASSKKTQSLIKARINEGFTLEDFKTVIDKKVLDWKEDAKWSVYLRPETLFGTKFEGYLNQKGAKIDSAGKFNTEQGF